MIARLRYVVFSLVIPAAIYGCMAAAGARDAVTGAASNPGAAGATSGLDGLLYVLGYAIAREALGFGTVYLKGRMGNGTGDTKRLSLPPG